MKSVRFEVRLERIKLAHDRCRLHARHDAHPLWAYAGGGGWRRSLRNIHQDVLLGLVLPRTPMRRVA